MLLQVTFCLTSLPTPTILRAKGRSTAAPLLFSAFQGGLVGCPGPADGFAASDVACVSVCELLDTATDSVIPVKHRPGTFSVIFSCVHGVYKDAVDAVLGKQGEMTHRCLPSQSLSRGWRRCGSQDGSDPWAMCP